MREAPPVTRRRRGRASAEPAQEMTDVNTAGENGGNGEQDNSESFE